MIKARRQEFTILHVYIVTLESFTRNSNEASSDITSEQTSHRKMICKSFLLFDIHEY